MNERYQHLLRKSGWWAAGCTIVLILGLGWCATHHVVRTEKGTVIVAKRFVTLSATCVDLRAWQWQDVETHPDLRDALVQAGYQALLPQPQGGTRLVRAAKSLTVHTYDACCRGLQKAANNVAGWLERAEARCFPAES